MQGAFWSPAQVGGEILCFIIMEESTSLAGGSTKPAARKRQPPSFDDKPMRRSHSMPTRSQTRVLNRRSLDGIQEEGEGQESSEIDRSESTAALKRKSNGSSSGQTSDHHKRVKEEKPEEPVEDMAAYNQWTQVNSCLRNTASLFAS